MRTVPLHSGEMSQDSRDGTAHPKGVAPDVAKTGPAARGKAMFHGLSASSAGLELGIAVAIGALFGHWLDTEYGTTPWLMLVFLVFGLIAGFRGLFRAIKRAEKADS
jgi:F0F1-type ATP synthase assembly protein I